MYNKYEYFYPSHACLYLCSTTMIPFVFVCRSAARLKQGQFAAALQDATRARELCPNWPKAYYRQGKTLPSYNYALHHINICGLCHNENQNIIQSCNSTKNTNAIAVSCHCICAIRHSCVPTAVIRRVTFFILFHYCSQDITFTLEYLT